MCCTSVIDWDYAVDMDFTDKMQAVWTDVQVAELVCVAVLCVMPEAAKL